MYWACKSEDGVVAVIYSANDPAERDHNLIESWPYDNAKDAKDAADDMSEDVTDE